MALYYGQDIKCDLSGDITLSNNGDIAIANSTESVLQHVAFRLRTSPDGFTASDSRVGANLAPFIGEQITDDLFQNIEDAIRLDITTFINNEDFFVAAVPVDEGQVMIFTKVDGLFIDSNGNTESNGFEATFSFPIFEGNAVQLIDYQAS